MKQDEHRNSTKSMIITTIVAMFHPHFNVLSKYLILLMCNEKCY